MKISDFKSWILMIFLLLSPVSTSVTKRRLCIEYKKENYLAKNEYITTLHADSEHRCMVNCVRRSSCMAFNYNAEEKTCILMQEAGCMSPLTSTSYLFVHLHPCNMQPVWYSVRPADRNWYWVTADDPNSNADVIKALEGSSTRYYLSRTLFQGYYLPGLYYWVYLLD